ncbi:hypothetical protein AOL_s00007g432 [Orbilia oligospora ATCC 24927]|uniref:Uncharacterized protein n=1 Tax=Arthrobotrys oligospora (strain ATCC 24927 / CBS 115.81 / DSM 1491) TaxID=756982 RepID=G1X2C3_ARTOA|nr:hypothetical protein AOL_s00007g432 [Orbilia oligospora ATCC 24927]EGX52649.1 hypothetical protein AOL_s00007g432 [Orbilia oligospora ATCC 24927]
MSSNQNGQGSVPRFSNRRSTPPHCPNTDTVAPASDIPGSINESEHTRAPQGLTNSDPDYTLVRVLILFFEYNDLNIKPETTQFKATCESLGYKVTVYKITMKDSWKCLKEILDGSFPIQDRETELRIIYYNGHGGINHNSSLTLARGVDTLQDIAEVNWRDIVKVVNEMECDTLAILDCCEAGAGATTTLAEENEHVIKYRKELIGACGWRAETSYHMTPTLCSVLRRGLPEVQNSMSTSTLIRRMNNRMVRIGKAAPQAVHYLLKRNEIDKIVLPRLKAIIPPDEWNIYESIQGKSLKGYNALILGGDTGIGRSAAITFSRKGADVTILYRAYAADQAMSRDPKNDAQAIVELARGCEGNVRLCPFKSDGSWVTSINSLKSKSRRQANMKFDILVNNLGYKFEDDNGENISSVERYDSAARLTFLEGNEVVEKALPLMKPISKIINTVSLEQSDGPFFKKEYQTAARVIEYLTKYQARQGEYTNHIVTAILPGVEWPPPAKDKGVENEEVVLSPSQKAAEVLRCFLWVAGPTREGVPEPKTGKTFHIGREG